MAVTAHGPGQPLDPGYARKNGLTFSGIPVRNAGQTLLLTESTRIIIRVK